MVEEIVPGSRVKYAEGGGPDLRCYRVNCDKIARTLPEFRPQWTVRRGIEQLYVAYKEHALTVEEFTGTRYIRLNIEILDLRRRASIPPFVGQRKCRDLIWGLSAKRCSAPTMIGIEEMLLSPNLQFGKPYHLKEDSANRGATSEAWVVYLTGVAYASPCRLCEVSQLCFQNNMTSSEETVIAAGRTGRRYLHDLWRYRELFLFLAWRDLLVRYKQTVVGVAWALIRPFLTMLVLTRSVQQIRQHALRGCPLSSPGILRHSSLAVLRHRFVRKRQQSSGKYRTYFQGLFSPAPHPGRQPHHRPGRFPDLAGIPWRADGLVSLGTARNHRVVTLVHAAGNVLPRSGWGCGSPH